MKDNDRGGRLTASYSDEPLALRVGEMISRAKSYLRASPGTIKRSTPSANEGPLSSLGMFIDGSKRGIRVTTQLALRCKFKRVCMITKAQLSNT